MDLPERRLPMLRLFGLLLNAIKWHSCKLLSSHGFIVTWMTYILIIFTYYIANGCHISFEDEELLNLAVITFMFMMIRVIAFFLKEAYPNADGFPIPKKRFTEVDEETGMVSIERDRLQELFIYTADLEDTFERKGML